MSVLTKFTDAEQPALDYAALAAKAKRELDGHCEIKLKCYTAFGIGDAEKKLGNPGICGHTMSHTVGTCGRRKVYLENGKFPVWNPPT